MNASSRTLALIFFWVWIPAFYSTAQEVAKSDFEEAIMSSQLPGYSVVLFSEDSIFYQGGFGYENVEQKKPFTPLTQLPIASVSKTFIGIALMQVIENGSLDLDSPINNILPFDVINPHHPNESITVRHLASHTSSIDDYNSEDMSFIVRQPSSIKRRMLSKASYRTMKKWKKNESTSLAKHLSKFLNPGGAKYRKRYFLKAPPGEKYKYSNLGAGLLALIIETVTETSFDDYVTENILSPLQLERTRWLKDLDLGDGLVATSYLENGNPVPRFTGLIYPAGGLVSNLSDLTTYLQVMIRACKGQRAGLDVHDFAEMFTPQLPDGQVGTGSSNRGLMWEVRERKIGHNGGNLGLIVLTDFDRDSGIGRIFMTNVSSYEGSEVITEVKRIWKALEDQSKKLQAIKS